MMVSKQIGIYELDSMAEELTNASQGERIWFFFGEMGAGKTTLIKHICTYLGVEDRVSSPTFSIVNEYRGIRDTRVYHFDFYRLHDESEIRDIGVEEYFNSGAYCLVEWPEIIMSIKPSSYFNIKIDPCTASKRIIEYTLTKTT